MEKIKASDILLMNESLTIEELRKFKFFAIDKNGDRCIYAEKPIRGLRFWEEDESNFRLIFGLGKSKLSNDWSESLREIYFEEGQQETQEQLYHKMFLHMSREHDLLLTNEQLYEIVLLAKKIKTHETDI